MSAVAVQATLLAGLGVLIGVPLGVLLGRLVWQRVADQAGMAAETTVSVLAVLGIAVATVVVANVVAAIPAPTRGAVAPRRRAQERLTRRLDSRARRPDDGCDGQWKLAAPWPRAK